jgi:uncharacterized protein YndB with AHSA1/START domain
MRTVVDQNEGDRMASNEQGDPRILSSLKSAGDQGVVVAQDRFPAAIEAVWAALTDRAQLARWLGDFQGELVMGGTYHSRFHASAAEGDHRIEACEPPTHFRVAGLDESGNGGRRVVEVTLQGVGDETVVTLVQTGLPLQWISVFGAGMQVHFEDLALHLAGKERSNSGARMEVLIPRYEELEVTAIDPRTLRA